jgi:hypothetical protein
MRKRGAQFGGMTQLLLRGQQQIGRAIRVLGFGQGLTGDLCAQDPEACIAAHHHRDVDIALGNRRAGHADQRLLEHAHRGQHRARARRPERRRDAPARIAIFPPPLRHQNAIQRGQQGGRARIVSCQPRRLQHQRQGVHRARRIVLALCCDADPDQHRRPVTEHHAGSVRAARPMPLSAG